jgi:hypothetical protein
MGSILPNRAFRQRLAADSGGAFHAKRPAIDDGSDSRAEDDGIIANRIFA